MKSLLCIACTALFTAFTAMPGLPAAAEARDDGEAAVTGSIDGTAPGETSSPSLDGTAFESAVTALVHEAVGDGYGGEDLDTEDNELIENLALQAFYAGAEAAPIWVGADGPSQKARDAAAEIARAGEWGLDPADYDVPDADAAGTGREALAQYELAMTRVALAYANHAKAGRVHPSEAGHSLNDPEPLQDVRAFLQSLRESGDAAEVLQGLHPKHPQFVALKKKLAELRGGGEDKQRTQIPDGPVLRQGDTHAQVALLRRRLDVEAESDAGENLYDEAVAAAVREFQESKGLKQDGILGNNTRHALNGQSGEQLVVRVLTNMERWRWLPDDMGGKAGIYAWVNIPEFHVRLVEDGKVVFSEKAIVGKTYKQTPVFSDQMEWIEIHPTWYVPNSIKVEDIKPSLRRPTSTVMERYNLRLDCGRHGRNWRAIDWNRVDIRNCSVSQPPGRNNVLGDFKFKFPNKHIVYMHDTPQKHLFKSATRAYSHGCVRVENPRKMAEILLGRDKGMSSSRLGEILAGPKRLHKEELNRFVPVHMTYFTAFFDEDGEFRTVRDVYGHDRRLADALTGKGNLLPVPAIARKRQRSPGPRNVREVQDHVGQNWYSWN